MRTLDEVQASFTNTALLDQAFTHRSWVNENPGKEANNERLEFLGDAILEFVVSQAIYAQFPDKEEGYLTALRANLVNTQTTRSVDTTVVALPQSNSTLLAIAQIKRLAQERALIVGEFKTSSVAASADDLGKSKVTFDVAVPDAGLLLAFLDSLEGVAPLLTLGDMNLIVSSDLLTGKVSVVTHWASFPESIPASGAPLVQLTASEQTTLSALQALTPPQIAGLQPTTPEARDNPFGVTQ